MPVTPVSTAPFSPSRVLQQWKDWDNSRDSFPGEHWIVLGAGMAVLVVASRSRSPVKRAIGSAIGSAMLARAASGRDGVAKLLPYVSALPAFKRLGR